MNWAKGKYLDRKLLTVVCFSEAFRGNKIPPRPERYTFSWYFMHNGHRNIKLRGLKVLRYSLYYIIQLRLFRMDSASK